MYSGIIIATFQFHYETNAKSFYFQLKCLLSPKCFFLPKRFSFNSNFNKKKFLKCLIEKDLLFQFRSERQEREKWTFYTKGKLWTFGMEWNGFVEAIKVKGGILLFLDKENNFLTWQPCCQSLINKENIILVEWGGE